MEHSSILFSSSSSSSISFTPFLPSLYHFLHFLCLLSSSFRALFGPLHQSVHFHMSYSCSDVGGFLSLFGIVCNIFHTVPKMFIIHAASEWLYWGKHRYLEFQRNLNIDFHPILHIAHCPYHQNAHCLKIREKRENGSNLKWHQPNQFLFEWGNIVFVRMNAYSVKVFVVLYWIWTLNNSKYILWNVMVLYCSILNNMSPSWDAKLHLKSNLVGSSRIRRLALWGPQEHL